MAEKQQDLADESLQEEVQSVTEELASTSEVSQADYQDLNNRYLRLAADFENFRKRQAQEREFLFKYGAQNTLEALMPVLDNLERAQQSLSETSEPQMLYKSFEMLAQQLLETLKSVGLQKMVPKGETFNPERHEAVSQVENSDVPDHTVLEVYQDGYLLHDRILRPASVVVSVKPEEAKPSGQQVESPEAEFKPTANDRDNPFKQASSKQKHGQ